MKAFLLIAALGLAETQAAPQAPATAATGTISGVVRIGDTTAPLPGAVVRFYRPDEPFDPSGLDLNRKPNFAKTNENGRFSFPDLPSGRYQLWVEDPQGFVWMDYRLYSGSVPVTLGSSQHVDDIVFRFVPRGSISGRVLDAKGEPLIGANVEAVSVIYRNGVRGLESLGVRPARTDAQGNYRIFWLSPGKYYVRTEYHPSTDDRPPKVYLPGTLDEDKAVTVEIKPGTELTGIDFSLVTPPVVPSYTVSGKVAGLPAMVADKPIEFLYLMIHGGKPGSRDQFSNTGGDISAGKFQIRGLRSGAYELWTQVRDDSGLIYTARTSIEVAGANLEGVVVDVLPVADLHGRILIDGKPPEKPFGPDTIPPRITAIEGTPDYASFQYESKGIQFNRDTGEFTIFRVPMGRYKIVYFPALPNGYLADVRQGNQSVLDGFAIGKDTSQAIEILSNSSGGTIEGLTIGKDLNPIFGAAVVLTTVPDAGRDADLLWGSGLTSDKNGHFIGRRLKPGQYRIYAWANPPVGDPWSNPEFMRRYELLGQTISVSAGSTTTVRVTAIPAGDE